MKRSLVAAALSGAAVHSLAAPAPAYEVKTTSVGAPLRWPAGELAIELALAGGPAEVSQEDAEAAAIGSITAWQGPLNGTEVSLVVSGTDSPAAVSGDGVPSIRWATEPGDEEIDAGRLAVTHIQYRVADGAIVDADVIVNAVEFAWAVSLDECRDAYDLEGTLTHELGHLIGLAHSLDETATMYATGGPCETLKRDLAPDDSAGADYLYRQLPLPDAEAGGDADGADGAADDSEDDGSSADDDGGGTGEPPLIVPAYGCQAGPGGRGGEGALPLAALTAALAILIRRRATRVALAHRSRRRAARSAPAHRSRRRSARSAPAHRSRRGSARSAPADRQSRRRSRLDRLSRAGLVALIAVGVAGTTAAAGELRRLGLAELSSRAGVIVRGVVVATRAAPGDVIATDATVVVFECLAGDCPQRLTVRRRGGEQEGRGLWVDGEADLRPGDQVVLYLAARHPVHRVIGGVQGSLRVEGQGSAARAVRDLRPHRVATGSRWRAGELERFDLAEVRAEARAARADRAASARRPRRERALTRAASAR